MSRICMAAVVPFSIAIGSRTVPCKVINVLSHRASRRGTSRRKKECHHVPTNILSSSLDMNLLKSEGLRAMEAACRKLGLTKKIGYVHQLANAHSPIAFWQILGTGAQRGAKPD